MYLYIISFMHIEMIHIVEILPHGRVRGQFFTLNIMAALYTLNVNSSFNII